MKGPFTVKIQRLGEPANANGRIYTTEVMASAIANFNKTTHGYNSIGTLGFPDDQNIDVSKISHTVHNLRIDENYMIGEIMILETECGNLLSLTLQDMEFRSSGVGKVNDVGIVSEYQILTISAVPRDQATF